MSGLELVVIVGGAIYINKKVQERKERKRIQRDIAAGIQQPEQSTTGSSSQLRSRTSSGRVTQQLPEPVEDEGLPPYSKRLRVPSRHPSHPEWATTIRLPTYEEVSGRPDDQGKQETEDDQLMARTISSEASSSSTTPSTSPLSTSTVPAVPAASKPEYVIEKRGGLWRKISTRAAAT